MDPQHKPLFYVHAVEVFPGFHNNFKLVEKLTGITAVEKKKMLLLLSIFSSHSKIKQKTNVNALNYNNQPIIHVRFLLGKCYRCYYGLANLSINA